MSATIEIAVESPRWADIAGAENAVRRAIEAALADCGANDFEVSVALADDARIRELNRQWRGKDAATNVLSFPAAAQPRGETRFLGDMVLACETIEREAANEAKPLLHHISHLAVHGTLHLLGYDHERDVDAEAMERRERDILARLGVPDPYAPAAARPTEPA